MSKTKIQWTDESWNVTTGCTRVSEGCDNCYAVAMTRRLAAIESTKSKYAGLVNEGKDHFNGNIKLHPDVLEEPLHWRKPRRVFVNSMSDLFHPEVPFEFIEKVFAVMAKAEDHTFQVLTKRPERMSQFLNEYFPVKHMIDTDSRKLGELRWKYGEEFQWPAPNIWLGTSVENQEAANERIPHLLECPASVRFLSCEPLLGPVDLTDIPKECAYSGEDITFNALSDKLDEGLFFEEDIQDSGMVGDGDCRKLHWVIAGGESGPGARPMHPDWVRSLRDQCQEVDVPFFFKQWGKWVSEFHPAASPSEMETSNKFVTYVDEDHNDVESREEAVDYYGQYMVNVGKKKAGRELDGKEWNQFPEVE